MNNNLESIMIGKEYLNKLNNKYEWKYMKRKEVYNMVLCASRGFILLGLNKFESVAIMGFNSPQWFISDIAAIFAGGIATGLYTTNNIGQCQYIINNCNAKIIVLENEKLLNKFLKINNNNNLGNVSTIIVWDDDKCVEKYNDNNNNKKLKVITWNKLINYYGNIDIDKYNKIINNRQYNLYPNNCATLIYTSGTTGNPKGVMLSHDNLIWTIKTTLLSQKHINWWNKNENKNNSKYKKHKIISYLPLSHIAAQCLDIYGPLLIAYNGGDGCIYFARNDALKGSLITTLKFVQPNIFLGVPRVWEKIEEKMRLIGKNGNIFVKIISKYSKKIGLIGAYNKSFDGNKKIPLFYNLINKLIFSTIKSKLGFNNLELAITGAAPIKLSTIKYFHSLNIILIEAYGMSESNGLISMGLPYFNKIGCVGPPLLGINIIINNNNNNNNNNKNEICVNGRNIMMGYLNNIKKTNETFCNNYYLKTGDIGKINNKLNILYITGRLKELIITSGGENIAPVPIEDYLKSILNCISNCILIGDKKKYLTLLITIKTINDQSIKLNHDSLQIDINCKTCIDAKKSIIWQKYIKNGIKTYNENTKQCISRAQKIQYFKILDKDFSINSGELTDTMKLKRNVIIEKYKHIIDSMYNK